MQNKYEVPELTLVGEADDVVMGMGFDGNDWPLETAADFEFQQD